MFNINGAKCAPVLQNADVRRCADERERIVPAWLEIMPDQMRILVHQLPVRTQIDTQVQEQLIVEYYSK